MDESDKNCWDFENLNIPSAEWNKYVSILPIYNAFNAKEHHEFTKNKSTTTDSILKQRDQ